MPFIQSSPPRLITTRDQSFARTLCHPDRAQGLQAHRVGALGVPTVREAVHS